MVKSYFYPNLGFRLQATQCSDTICSGPALKIGKIPVYSANPWIESFAHTVHDAVSQQRSFYYMNDPKYKVFYYKLHSSRLAQE